MKPERHVVSHFSNAERSAVQKRAQGEHGAINHDRLWFGRQQNLESLLMWSMVSAVSCGTRSVQRDPFVCTQVEASFSSRRDDRAVKAAEHEWSEARSNRGGTTASERPPPAQADCIVFPPSRLFFIASMKTTASKYSSFPPSQPLILLFSPRFRSPFSTFGQW
jgi:hypothetical protein